MKKLIIALAASIAFATGSTVAAVAASSAAPSQVPVCERVAVQENSGTGPAYTVRLCGATSLPVKSIIIDGSLLPEKTVTWQPVALWSGTAASSAPLATGLSPLAGCFGHNGIQASGLIAYECISQPSGLGGALYWSANEANLNWDKHPGSGLDWVEASTIHMTPDSNPVNTKHDFWTGIANSSGNFCSVINPGYAQEPTMCAFPGQPAHVMSVRQQASYDQFEAAMEASNIPDCAWSMTIDSSQCDIDS